MNHFLAFPQRKKWWHLTTSRLSYFLILALILVGCSESSETPPPEATQPPPSEITTAEASEINESPQEITDEPISNDDGTETTQETDQNSDQTAPESEDPFANLNQEWIPNLGSLKPIQNSSFVDVPAFLIAENLGAWQNDFEVGYGFKLTNSSADHYISNLEYTITISGADGNISEEHTVRLRELYPLEEVNVGETFFLSSDFDYDTIEVSIISAESVSITTTPIPLVWQPGFDANFSETGIWVRQKQFAEDGTSIPPEDTNEIQFNFEVINPNGAFVATNSTFSISVFDNAGNILVQGQGALGDILPLQSGELKGSLYVQSPELINNVEIIIEPEQFTPIDPAIIPSRLIQKDQIIFAGQNVNIVFPGQIDYEFHLTEMLTDGGFGKIVAIAYDENGLSIGGGAHELLSPQFGTTMQSILMPIQASSLPANIELYILYDAIDGKPPRGGGGSHPGRDI